jgi:hypothetical protein
MPNGRLHDNPVSDIVIWGQEVYGEELDALVREVAALLPAMTEQLLHRL